MVEVDDAIVALDAQVSLRALQDSTDPVLAHKEADLILLRLVRRFVPEGELVAEEFEAISHFGERAA